jgi:hypothetical protein
MEEVFCGGTTDPVKMKAGFMLEKVKALPSLFLGACHSSYHSHAYAPQNKVPWFAKVLEGGGGVLTIFERTLMGFNFIFKNEN